MSAMDYSLFDGLVDSILILDEDRKIVFANEVAATLCESSVKRMTKGKKFFELMSLQDETLFPMKDGVVGKQTPTPMQEISFTLPSGKAGKVQIAIQPFKEDGQPRWVVVMRDVTLEEVLHAKYRGELEQKEVVIEELKRAKDELEDFSKNLQRLVDERTAEVRQANRMLEAIMNSLGQGFLVFNKEGLCLDIYTLACKDILEKLPQRMQVQDVLELEGNHRTEFNSWMGAVFQEALPFETLMELAPKNYKHKQGKFITLDYFAIRSDTDAKIQNIVLVATDKTNEHEAQIALEKEKQYAKFVLKVLMNRKQFALFLENLNGTIKSLENLIVLDQPQTFDYMQAFRILHTIEGESATFSAMKIRAESRVAQEVLEPLKLGEATPDSTFMKKFKVALDQFALAVLDFSRENKELFAALRIGGEKVFELKESELKNFIGQFKTTSGNADVWNQLQQEIQKEYLADSVRHFDDVVQHVAEKQGKKIKPVVFECDNVRIISGAYDSLFSVLVHAFRNAVDHGIEPSEEREFAGKPAEGSITVRAHRKMEKNTPWLYFEIEDDGQGIDPSRISKKMKEKNPQFSTEGMSEQDIIQLIFDPGFSTRDQIGEFSGRGIGMDAVKTEIVDRGGWIIVDSVLGQKTVFRFMVPEIQSHVAKAA